MLGGIDTGLFLQGIGGFIVMPIFILILRWAFPSKKDPAETALRKEIKRDLRRLKRK